MPDVPGLIFRHFRGESDFPAMAEIVNSYAAANGDDWVETVEELAVEYAHLTNCDLATDFLAAEVDGRLVGYWRVEWWDETNGPLLYGAVHFLQPEWRGRGVSHAALNWVESRLRTIAGGHDPLRSKAFTTYVSKGNTYLATILVSSGYQPARHFYKMVRPSLDDIPDFPLPEGLEVRPVRPEQYRAIWDADIDAFRDHWGFAEPKDEDYAYWLENKAIFQPELWQIAWDPATDQVAGQVRTFIGHAENEQHNRLRGYTEFISVRRPYRRRGLARALIALSLQAQREAGMTESALSVDSENPTGANRVYEDCGFRVVSGGAVYRKPL
jgi:GNAT superfamily N-acetyltransferase